VNVTPSTSHRTGLVLAAHGARDERTVDATHAQAAMIAERLPGVPIETGFLEFTRPTIAEAIAKLAERGVDEALIVPLFLAAGAHVERDLPAIVREARTEHAGLALRLASHIGTHGALLGVPTDAIGGLGVVESGLVVLAHGSRRESALAETRQFTQRLAERIGASRSATGFLAMGAPRADAVLREAAAWPVDRVVVHGHFLFPGRMIDTVDQLLDATRQAHPRIDWRRTGPLGPSDAVAMAVAECVAGCRGRACRGHA
jgi:sirohydrochlorin cobaltochelatase